MKVEFLRTENEKKEALKLLYKLYHKTFNWSPSESNPSGYRIQDEMIVDDFVEKSAYFGVFKNSELVATARVILPDKNLTEASLYQKNSFLTETTGELNRYAILPEYFQSEATLMLFYFIFDWCYKNLELSNIVTTVSYPEPGNFLEKLGFEKVSKEFKYSVSDPNYVTLLSFDFSDGNVIKTLNMIKNLIDNTVT